MHNEKTHVRTHKGMCGLKEAEALACNDLKHHLGQYGHHPSK